MFVFFFLFFGDPHRIALCDPCSCLHKWGYPFTFIEESRVGADIDTFECGTKITNYNYSNLVFDLLLWYLVSYLFYYFIRSIKQKANRSGRNVT